MNKLIATILIGLSLTLPVYSKPDIVVKLENQKIVLKDKKEVYEAGEKAKPGDTLLYRVIISNNGDSEARKLSPVAPIPEGTIYIKENSLYETLYTIDGKSFEKEPKIKVKENGKEVMKNAPIEMYKGIKWVIDKPLKANQTLVISYKVKLK